MTPRYATCRASGSFQDPGTHHAQLLLAQDQPGRAQLCGRVQCVLAHQATTCAPRCTIATTCSSRRPLAHGVRRPHRTATCIEWIRCYLCCSGQVLQADARSSDAHHAHCRRDGQDIPRPGVQAPWSASQGHPRPRTPVPVKVHDCVLCLARNREQPLDGLPPSDGRTDGARQPGTGTVLQGLP